MADGALEALRAAVPALRGLPLLRFAGARRGGQHQPRLPAAAATARRPAAMLDHAGIAARIPHQGAMCLLDAVVDWSETAISCRAVSHADPANPLRADGRLGAAAGIEYAAQAMAVHGALLAAASERPAPRLPGQRARRTPACRPPRRPGRRAEYHGRTPLRRRQPHPLPVRCQPCRPLPLEGRAAVILDAEKESSS